MMHKKVIIQYKFENVDTNDDNFVMSFAFFFIDKLHYIFLTTLKLDFDEKFGNIISFCWL